MGVNVHLHIKKKEDKSGVEYYVDLCKLEVRLENSLYMAGACHKGARESAF